MAETHASLGRPHLPGVESLRAYAAFAIVIFHVIHMVGAPVPQSLEFMKWFFGYGVPLFFVVSAFSLAYGYAGRLSGTSRITEFYLRRLLRITPLYYLAVGAQLLALHAVGAPQPSLAALALSLTFLFNLNPALVDGIAPASWSIGVEMLFYAALPVVLAVAKTLARTVALTAAFLGVMILFSLATVSAGLPHAFMVHGVLFNLPYFGAGLIAFHLIGTTPRKWGGPIAFGALALLVAIWGVVQVSGQAFAPLPQQLLYQAFWSVPFAMLCLGMALDPPRLLSNRLTQFLGKISFGLYLGHPHVIFVLNSLGVYERIHRLPGGSGVTFPLSVFVTSLAVIPLAWLLFWFVESPGIALGRRLALQIRAGDGGRGESLRNA